MKSLLLATLVTFGLVASAFGQEAVNANYASATGAAATQQGEAKTDLSVTKKVPNWTFSLSSTAASQYVGGTGGALFTNKPVWQTGITAFHKSGFYAGAWTSKPFDPKYAHTFADETDWYVGYNRTFGGWNFDLSAGVYDLVPTSDLYDVNLTVTATGGKIKPYGVIEHDFSQSARLMPGTVYKFGLRGGIDRMPLTWDTAVLGNYGPNPYGGKADVISAGWLQLGWPIKAWSGTLTPAMVIQKSFGQTGGIAHDQTIYRLTYSVGF